MHGGGVSLPYGLNGVLLPAVRSKAVKRKGLVFDSSMIHSEK